MSPVDLKIVLLGKEYCGKTSLVERFVYNRFRGDLPYQNTIGAAFGAKKVEVDGEKVTLGVWDTAGSERYEAMCRIYYRDAGAAVVCYDLTSSESFERAKFWVQELRKHEPNCRLYLCGTKNDLIQDDRRQRKVDYHNVTDYADEIMAVGVFETSSKNNIGVYELFLKIAEDHVRYKVAKVEHGLERLSLDNSAITRRNSCC